MHLILPAVMPIINLSIYTHSRPSGVFVFAIGEKKRHFRKAYLYTPKAELFCNQCDPYRGNPIRPTPPINADLSNAPTITQ